MDKDWMFVLNRVAQAIYDKKGSNILCLDMRKFSCITDYVIIAEGNVDRHVIAIASAIEEALKEIGVEVSHKEGLNRGDWVVLDYLQIMVHLFIPGIREKYQLEQLWKEAEIVDLSINVDLARFIAL